MTPGKSLPPPEKDRLKVGYLRLTDSAPLIIARADGLFARYGLDVELVREVSWANLRDKLVVGQLDAAQLLAPLLMMTSFGAGGLRANLMTGLSLSMNGNAITLSRTLWDALADRADHGNALAMAREFARHVKAQAPDTMPTLATVHMFSMHTLLMRLWLRAGGLDPDRDVRIIVLPPEQMGDSLARGIIDGFCVGEPWNTLAVQRGTGAMAATGYAIWNNAPEKVLAVSETWHHHNPATHLRLRLALMEACESLREVVHRERVAEILSRPEYLNLPVKTLLPSLAGKIQMAKHLPPVDQPHFHLFGRFLAGFPWRSQADWMVRRSSELLGKTIADDQLGTLVQQSYRPDLYREAARYLNLPTPNKDYKSEGCHDSPWELGEGITLGPDLMISGQ